MKLQTANFQLTHAPREQLVLAMALGLCGFILNTFELQLGWGMHFIFGNAIVFAFIRILAPSTFVLAASISSMWTVFLWHHPWAWAVWVCEAVFLAVFAPRSSPVRSDVLFWLVLGAPMLLITYGAVMSMDELSLLLVVAKQSVNGVLNVIVGELLYVALVGINPLRKFGHWPRVRVESAVITVLLGVILIPTAVYLSLEAPSREQMAQNEVGSGLEHRLRASDVALNSWVQSRSLVLRIHAESHFDSSISHKQHFLDELSTDFEKISIISPKGTFGWTSASELEKVELAELTTAQNRRLAQGGIRLEILKDSTGAASKFVLIVPFRADGSAGVIVADVRNGVLQKLVNGQGQTTQYAVFLVNAVQGAVSLTPASAALQKRVQSLSSAERLASMNSPVLLRSMSPGRAVMSDLREGQILRSSVLAELPEWQVAAAAPLAPAVAEARGAQLEQFIAVIAFVLLITPMASALSRGMTVTLGRLSQSADDLSVIGAARTPPVGLVIHEVNEISGKIASAGTTVVRDRGALANHQRRLNNITQHAPAIVYALDIMEGGKGKLVYVSDSLEKILGYTAADTDEPGWWIRSLHPDDTVSSIAAFRHLSADTVVNVEYRMRHKNGHYVWVNDSVSVEANPHTGKLEGVGVIMDISERKAAALQLLQADKMASLGRMISGTAHELNQPLNFIKMAATNLRENTVRGQIDADRLMPKLENVLAQVERASAIILQMRIFGRIPKEQPYPLDVKKAVDAAVSMIAPQFELDGTHVEVTEKSEQVYVQALPMLLEQVLLNLLLNANDAIKTQDANHKAKPGKIKITVGRRKQVAVITVEDNGPGISTDVLGKIFDPFFTTKAPKEGTGLGLSISYGIIRDLGGVILASATRRGGARFTIELPLAESTASEATSSATASKAQV